MTVSELDRWRVAQQLIAAHADKAEPECDRRAAEFVKTGELEGFRLWQGIALKVRHLLPKIVGDSQKMFDRPTDPGTLSVANIRR